MAATAAVSVFPELERFQKELFKGRLTETLETLPGSKDLVLEGCLMRPLDRIAGAQLLKQHGVNKIFKLEPSAKGIQGISQRIYVVRPDMVTVKHICDHINAEKQGTSKRSYLIAFVPRKLHTCELILEQEGVAGDAQTTELVLDLIPIDADIFSLQMPNMFKDTFLHGDQTWLPSIARSLVSIQNLFGTIPNVYGQGRYAEMVRDLLTRLDGMEDTSVRPKNPEIGHLVIIDREVDYVTPLCVQMTYESLLDDVFGIDTGIIELNSEVTGKPGALKLPLSAKDPLFEEVRNRHFTNVFPYLSSKAKQLQTGYDKRHQLSSVRDMRDFVSQELGGLKEQHKSLVHHITACEWILNKKTRGDFEAQLHTEHSILQGGESRENVAYIEEAMHKQYPWQVPLKLLCLHSLVRDGIPPKDYLNLRNQYLQSYGFEKLVLWSSLQQLGMLTEQTSGSQVAAASLASLTRRSAFRAVAKKLSLMPPNETYDVKSPPDMAYVFSGVFVPISCKLVEALISREGWAGMEEVGKLLPGNAFAKVKATSLPKDPSGGRSSLPPAPKVVLVYFVGGCTYAEVAALRFLGRVRGYKFIIATTNMTNSERLLNEIAETS